MIVKKLYRKVKLKWWNKERQKHELTIITDYVGWFLFGFIPIYLIQLDKIEKYKPNDDEEELKIREAIREDYNYLMRGEKYADCKR